MADDDPKGPDLAEGLPLSGLPHDRPIGGVFDGEPVVLVRERGAWCAWSGRCTHLGAPLDEGLVVDGTLRCSWHHARFSLATGEAIAAPAFEPLVRYDVVERDGRVRVTGKARVSKAPTLVPADRRRVVIVGGGAGGHACAELLVRREFGGDVTVIADDADAPYDRTACSKQYLIGMVSRDETRLDGCDIGPILRRARVRSIDPQAGTVALDDGAVVAFDVLVLATGAEPRRPDLPGFDRPEVHLLRTLADADAIVAAAKPGRRAAVIGASFIGLEAAASLTQREVAVHVVAPDDPPLKRVVGAEVGAMIRAVHEEKGVVFHAGREARSWDGAVLTLDDGSTILADFVVLGLGVKPRTELAAAAGLAMAPDDEGGGVIVDERLRTSVPCIHAIGDIARYPDPRIGAGIRVEHWVHAQRQGQFVARSLLGEAARYDDLPFFWSAHFDTGLRYVGHVDEIADSRVDGSIAGRDFTIRYTGDGDERAFVTCNRDMPSLTTERDWEEEESEPE